MPNISLKDRVERWNRIKQLRADGCTYPQIARRLGICRNTVGNALARQVSEPKPSLPYNLTKSQLVVAKLLIEGKSNRKIAELLVLSKKCIDWHIFRIYEKLDISGDPSISKRVVAISMLKEVLERSL